MTEVVKNKLDEICPAEGSDARVYAKVSHVRQVDVVLTIQTNFRGITPELAQELMRKGEQFYFELDVKGGKSVESAFSGWSFRFSPLHQSNRARLGWRKLQKELASEVREIRCAVAVQLDDGVDLLILERPCKVSGYYPLVGLQLYRGRLQYSSSLVSSPLGDTRFGRPQIRITYELASAFREGQPYFWEFPLTKAYDPRFSDFPKDEHGHNVFTDFRELSIPIFRPGEGQWDDPKNRERFESFIGMRNALRTDRDWVDFLYQLAGRYVKGGEIICPVTPLEEERDSEACRRGNGHPPRPLNGGTEVFRGDAKYLIPVPPCIISRVEVDGREFCVLDGATSRHRFAIRIWPGENEADAVAYAQGKSVEARESAKRTMIGAKILHVHDWKERLYDRMRKYRPAVDVTS